uniref:Uncharacterized protein n=1 Tax=Timema genevievae TaxID=629358 RepID=A0A7R9JZQ3_TIMGE|nr:unnamed protein product [Timema genevievae]
MFDLQLVVIWQSTNIRNIIGLGARAAFGPGKQGGCPGRRLEGVGYKGRRNPVRAQNLPRAVLDWVRGRRLPNNFSELQKRSLADVPSSASLLPESSDVHHVLLPVRAIRLSTSYANVLGMGKVEFRGSEPTFAWRETWPYTARSRESSRPLGSLHAEWFFPVAVHGTVP